MINIRKIILIIIIIFLGLLIFYPEKETVEKVIENKSLNLPTITLTTGSETRILNLVEGQTLYEALTDKHNSLSVPLDGKVYPGLGFLVTNIGALHSGNGKYLFYSINGVNASSGISSYIPQNGDIIKWELK